MTAPLFRDRAYAGRLLAQRFMPLAGNPDVVVLGLARGGVPVAYEVATAIHAPLDVFIARTLDVPGREDYAMGAIAEGGVRALKRSVVAGLGISQHTVDRVATREQRELERRVDVYRAGRPVAVRGETVVLVDDGIATGAEMAAAIAAIRRLGAAAVAVGAPTMSAGALRALRPLADHIECLVAPDPFGSVGVHYADFPPLTDADVWLLLSARRTEAAALNASDGTRYRFLAG